MNLNLGKNFPNFSKVVNKEDSNETVEKDNSLLLCYDLRHVFCGKSCPFIFSQICLYTHLCILELIHASIHWSCMNLRLQIKGIRNTKTSKYRSWPGGLCNLCWSPQNNQASFQAQFFKFDTEINPIKCWKKCYHLIIGYQSKL